MFKPTNDSERLENYRFRLSLVTTVTDKLLLASILAVFAYLLNRSLETYKADLQSQLAQQKAQQESSLLALRQSHDVSIANLRSSHEKALLAATASQNAQLEEVRASQQRAMEGVKQALQVRGDVVRRRLAAVEALYDAGVDLMTELEKAKTLPVDQQPVYRRDQVIQFYRKWRSNRLFVTGPAAEQIDGVLRRMQVEDIVTGKRQSLDQLDNKIGSALNNLKKYLEEEVKRESGLGA